MRPRDLFSLPFRFHYRGDGIDDVELLRSWRNGLDTYEIAQKYFIKEAEVYRRLWAMRECEREYHEPRPG